MDRKQQEYKYLFGPVPSRRLGISLGVDLMPHKTCSLDCVYCECGRTTHLTLQRDEYTSVDAIQKELASFLSSGPVLDHITFSGSGEPLLHSHVREVILFLKREFPQYKLALLTNGTLLSESRVREDILEIDIVKVSVDTVSENIFIPLNRPHPDLNIAAMMDGLFSFKELFQNQLWVEFFLVPGMNDDPAELRSIKTILDAIQPDRIHVNTLDRPGTEKWVRAAHQEKLIHIADCLGGADLIGRSPMDTKKRRNIGNFRQHLLSTIKRRPCTAEDVSKIMGTHISETKRLLDVLAKRGEIEKQEMPGGAFYLMKL